MTKLDRVGLYAAPRLDDRTTYCGPTALAALTGHTIDYVEQNVLALRSVFPPPRGGWSWDGAAVRTMWVSEMGRVVASLGYRCAETRPGSPMTFARWLRSIRAAEGGRFLILVTGHFVAVAGGEFVDTQFRTPIPVRKAPVMRKRVVCWWRLEPREG